MLTSTEWRYDQPKHNKRDETSNKYQTGTTHFTSCDPECQLETRIPIVRSLLKHQIAGEKQSLHKKIVAPEF